LELPDSGQLQKRAYDLGIVPSTQRGAAAERSLIEATFPPAAYSGMDVRQLVDDHTRLSSASAAGLRRTDRLLQFTFEGGLPAALTIPVCGSTWSSATDFW
jgi:hypothetical protein